MNRVRRSGLTVLAGGGSLVTPAGACGDGEDDEEDGVPGVPQQDGEDGAA